jgi:TPR repeat protein
MYYKGLGVTKDLAMARIWFKKSQDQGCVDSQRRLGMMMATGEGGAKDFLQGFAFVKRAAERGDDTAAELVQKHYAIVNETWCEPLP